MPNRNLVLVKRTCLIETWPRAEPNRELANEESNKEKGKKRRGEKMGSIAAIKIVFGTRELS